MIYLKIAVLCLSTVAGSIIDKDKIDAMISEEIQKLLHTNFVPKYEFVEIELSEKSHKREVEEERRLHIKAFGEDINLWLELGDTILAGEDTPVYYANHSPGKPENVEFTRQDGLMQNVGSIYEDAARRASLVISKDQKGRPTVNGYIGSLNLAIMSLSRRVIEEFRKKGWSVGDSDKTNLPNHIIYKAAETYLNNDTEPEINSTTFLERLAESDIKDIPDTLYVELLVVVEHSMCKIFGQDISGLLEYIVAFVNGIDLRYRSVEDPKLRLHISGIVVAQDAEATPYISNNSLGVDVFDTYKALPAAAAFFYAVKDTFPLKSYDIPLTLTRQAFGLDKQGLILGQAWVGAVCKRSHRTKKVKSATVIKDYMSFGGIHVAAHEIGHLLGARHDNGTRQDDCFYSNGFIMSYTPVYTKNSSDFSTCSMAGINRKLLLAGLECLYNKPPSSGRRIPKILPGQIMSLENQCKAINARAPCQNPDGPTDICVRMYCETLLGECLQTRMAAADGTPCGDDKICLHMECVDL